MKAIMKTIKPKTCANIMNLIQSILVIKNKREATAIQKLINENGYAEIYVYCSKGKRNNEDLAYCTDTNKWKLWYGSLMKRNGKVVFKFRCYKVEEVKFIMDYIYGGYYNTNSYANEKCFERDCRLTLKELDNYINKNNLNKRDNVAYALHISNLKIFDKPKELSEFYKVGKMQSYKDCQHLLSKNDEKYYKLTKAPQNFCYVEVE